jgi:hypothetical protein
LEVAAKEALLGPARRAFQGAVQEASQVTAQRPGKWLPKCRGPSELFKGP